LNPINEEILAFGLLILLMSIVSLYVSISVSFINGIAVGVVCSIGVLLILGIRYGVNNLESTLQSYPSIEDEKK
jgi:hypothetical protein